MSTVKAINLQHPSSANTNIALDNNGNVGIGNGSPSQKLRIDQNVASSIHGYAAKFVDNTNAAVNYAPFDFVNAHSNHSWGTVARFRVEQGTASDRPSIQFSSGQSDNRWSIGFCSSGDDHFRINSNLGLRNDGINDDGWGTERLRINMGSGTVHLSGGNGASQLAMHNGGDLTIYSASDSYATTVWCDPPQTGMDGSGDYVWVSNLNNHRQKCGYDRLWDNYPCISVRNDTTNGPQGEFRVHGINGISGGDFSVNFRIDGGTYYTSDKRRKTEIEVIDDALERVCQLEGVSFYTVRSDGRVEKDLSVHGKRFGFIAQDAVKSIPECVKFYPEADTPNEIGYANAYSLDYPGVTPLLVEAIKTLKTQVDSLKKELDELKSK